MSRWSARAVIALLAAGATACSSDPVAPAASLSPGGPSRDIVVVGAYVASLLPLANARFISATGGVIGTATDGRVAYYRAGTITRLQMPAGYGLLELPSLSDDDRVAVTGYAPPITSAFYYASPSAAPVDILPNVRAQVSAINEQGVVAGTYSPAAGGTKVFRWSASGGLADITPPGTTSIVVTDISSDGYVTGPGNLRKGFWPLYTYPFTYYRLSPNGSSAADMSTSYRPIQALTGGGVLATGPGGHEVIWTPAGAQPVGPAPGVKRVTRISARGRYVGYYIDRDTGQERAWTSTGGAGATTLPMPAGATATRAVDVNPCGTILGYATYAPGHTQPVVWGRAFACDGSDTLYR